MGAGRMEVQLGINVNAYSLISFQKPLSVLEHSVIIGALDFHESSRNKKKTTIIV